MTRAIINGVLFVTLLAIPMVAEVITATPGNVPGTGFDVLLYEPFDFAFVLLAGVLFVAGNMYLVNQCKATLLAGLGIGSAMWILWFFISFLAVAQLHHSLGGIL